MLSQRTDPLLYGKPLVKPASIETELEKIRTAAAAQDVKKDGGSSENTRARATLCNLIIFNPSDQADVIVDELVNELCLSHPSRFFIVDSNLPDNVAANGIATAVSSRCFLADSGAHVCSEEVYISVKPAAIPLVPNLLMSLLAPDVDIVLLILGDPLAAPAATPLLADLVELANRVIYDSGELSSYSIGVRALDVPGMGSPTKSSPVELADLQWQRTRRWRSMISEGFDAERLAHSTPQINRVAICCQSSPDELRSGRIPADALLLAAWILVSLSQKLKTPSVSNTVSGVSIEFENGQSALQLEFVGDPQPDWQGQKPGLRSIEIVAETKESIAHLKIARMLEQGTLELATGISDTIESGKSTCDFSTRSAPFLVPKYHELIAANMVSRRDDTNYLKALQLSVTLAELFSRK